MALDVNNTGNLNVNGDIEVCTPLDATKAGYIILAGELAEQTDPTGRIVSDIRTSAQGRLSVGQANILLNEIFSGVAVNPNIWTAPVTTMAIAAGTTTLNINSAAGLATNTVARLQTYAHFPLQCDLSTFALWELLYTQVPQANAVTEMGLFQCSASTVPTDGAFFRFDASGTFHAVLVNNSVQTGDVTIAAIPSANAMHKYKIICENDRVLFYVDGICVAVINSGADMGMPMNLQAQPFAVRHYIGTPVPSLGSTLKLAYVCVGNQDFGAMGKDYPTLGAIAGKNGNNWQSGQTNTGLCTSLNANVTSTVNPAGAAMTNTTAALGVGLGGVFSAQPTLAQGIDGILCSFQNPAASATIPGRTLYIKGVKVAGIVTTALTGGPLAYGYYLDYGRNGTVTLVGADAATTKGARRVAIGVEGCIAAAAVGVLLSPGGAYMQFTSPIAVYPGEFVAVVARNFGTVTTAGVVSFLVGFDSFWE